MNLSLNSWQVWALGSALCAALTAIFGKIGVHDVDSNLATAIRTLVILPLAWGIAAADGVLPQIKDLSRHTVLFLVLSGLATGASWLCYYRALKIGHANQVAPIDKLSVVFVIFLAAIFLKEPLTPKVLLGAGLIAGGALLLAR